MALTTESKESQIVRAVLEDLRNRKGFDWWWDDIDPEIRVEIMTELEDKVRPLI